MTACAWALAALAGAFGWAVVAVVHGGTRRPSPPPPTPRTSGSEMVRRLAAAAEAERARDPELAELLENAGLGMERLLDSAMHSDGRRLEAEARARRMASRLAAITTAQRRGG